MPQHGLSEDDAANYQLKDERYGFIHSPHAFVKEVYFRKVEFKVKCKILLYLIWIGVIWVICIDMVMANYKTLPSTHGWFRPTAGLVYIWYGVGYSLRETYAYSMWNQLSLVEMDPKEASQQIKQRTISTLLEEIQKLRFTIQLLVSRKCSEDKQVNASFLLEEFLRLHSFPRKVCLKY